MKSFNRILISCLKVAFLSRAICAEAENAVECEWNYLVNDDETITITGINSESNSSIVIPSVIDGHLVTCIANLDCGELTNVSIPISVTNIGQNAFHYCPKILSFAVEVGNPVYKSVAGMLLSKDGTTLIRGVTGDVSIPDCVLIVGRGAFWGFSGLTSVTIPEGVVHIEESAFFDCISLTRVRIPDSLTNIGERAFSGCNELLFDTNTIAGVKLVDGWVVGYTSTNLKPILDLSGIRGISGGAFAWCNSLSGVTIPITVKGIGSYAFWGCDKLKGIYISDLTSWCRIHFDSPGFSCQHTLYLNGEPIADCVIPNGITSIEDYAFSCCSSLTNITLSACVTNIGKFAFSGCSSLSNLTMPDGIMGIGEAAFANCALVDVKLPSNITSVKDHVFENCNCLTNVTLPNGVIDIGYMAFSGCGTLATVNLPNDVKNIGAGAFSCCSSLRYIVIPSGVTNIGEHAFANCSSMEIAYIPGDLTHIEDGVFSNTHGIFNVRYGQPEWVTMTFDANGGNLSCTSISATQIAGVRILELPKALREGHLFVGWWTEPYGGNLVTAETLVSSETTRLYAHWLRFNTYGYQVWSQKGNGQCVSGNIDYPDVSCMELIVYGEGTLSFNWSVSTRKEYGWLSFEIDDVFKGAITGDGRGEQTYVVTGSGRHVFQWKYSENYYKYGSTTGCGYVSAITWNPSSPCCLISQVREDATPQMIMSVIESADYVDETRIKATVGGSPTAYNQFVLWAKNVKGPGGNIAGDVAVVVNSNVSQSFLLGSDKLINKALTSDDVKIESFTPASTDGKFEFTVSVKDVNIGGGSVAVETLKENLKKVLGIEGAATLSPGGFSSDNIDITFDAPVDGKARFTVSPPVDAGSSFFMRVKVK